MFFGNSRRLNYFHLAPSSEMGPRKEKEGNVLLWGKRFLPRTPPHLTSGLHATSGRVDQKFRRVNRGQINVPYPLI